MTPSDTLKQYISALESAASAWASSVSLQLSLLSKLRHEEIAFPELDPLSSLGRKEHAGTQTEGSEYSRPLVIEAGTDTGSDVARPWTLQLVENVRISSDDRRGLRDPFHDPFADSTYVLQGQSKRNVCSDAERSESIKRAVRTSVHRKAPASPRRQPQPQLAARASRRLPKGGSIRQSRRTCALIARDVVAAAVQQPSKRKRALEDQTVRDKHWEAIKKERAKERMNLLTQMLRAQYKQKHAAEWDVCERNHPLPSRVPFGTIEPRVCIFDTLHTSASAFKEE